MAKSTSSGISYCRYCAAVGPVLALAQPIPSEMVSELCAYKRRERFLAGSINVLSSAAAAPPIGSALQCCCGIELCTVGGAKGAPVGGALFTGNVALVDGAITMAADDEEEDDVDEDDDVVEEHEAVELLDAPELQGGLIDATEVPIPSIFEALHHCS